MKNAASAYNLLEIYKNKEVLDNIMYIALKAKTEKYFRNNDFEKTSFVALVNSPYRNKEIIPSSVYKSYRTVFFEGEIFNAVEDYDTYLKAVFGDYMKLPPIEKRVTHHSFDAYWK